MCRRLVCHSDDQAGFTLLELVVVIGAIAVVMAVLSVGIRRASDAFSLRRGASVATSELRRAHATAVSEGVDYTVEFVLANPGSLNTYRTKLVTETCPTGMTQVSSTLCRRTVAGQQWPASVAINGPATTLAVCTAPANPANKCVTFRPLGYANAGGVVQLLSRSGVTVNVQVTAATGRVSIQP